MVDKANAPTTTEAEIELKLLTDKRTARSIWAHPAVKPLINAPIRTRHIKTTYYDTPDNDLLARECALRVRCVGNQFEQHLKTAGHSFGGVFHRKEWQTPLSGPKPDISAWEGRPLTLLKPYAKHIQALFESDMERTDGLLICDDFTIEIAIDIGVIRSFDEHGATAKETPLTEIELELKSGSPHFIHELARKLAETLPVRLGWQSKAQRGYNLCLNLAPPPQHAKKLQFSKEQHVHAIGQFLSEGMNHYLANAANIEVKGDVEAIHQARVACRRIRAGLAFARPFLPEEDYVMLRCGYRDLAAVMGPIRDMDVLVTETFPPVITAEETPPEISSTLNAMIEGSAKRRKTLLRAAQRKVRATETTQLVLKLAHYINVLCTSEDDASIDKSALHLLRKHFKPLKKSHKILLRREPEDCHNLRIAAKKLRYTSEFYAALSGNKPLKKVTEVLAAMQQALGDMNDVANIPVLMRSMAPKTQNNMIATGYLIGWYAHRNRHALDQAIEISRGIKEPSILNPTAESPNRSRNSDS